MQSPRSSTDELAQGLEMGRGGGADPLEHDHFGSDHLNARRSEAMDRNLPALRPARCRRVDCDEHVVTVGLRLDSRLQYADMRLDPAQNEVRAGMRAQRRAYRLV